MDNKFKDEKFYSVEMQQAYQKLFWKIAKKMTEGIYLGQIEELKENQKNSNKKPLI